MSEALGDALLRTWGGAGRYRSYTATGWHAQITKLTESQRGYDAIAAAGIDITPRTLLTWLSEDGRPGDFAPSAANRGKIQQAYDIMAGGWDSRNESRDYRIHGTVQLGSDVRQRGDGSRQAPLLVKGKGGDWSNIRDAWNDGSLTAEDAGDMFIEDVIEHDPALASTSDPWEFPGSYYTIT